MYKTTSLNRRMLSDQRLTFTDVKVLGALGAVEDITAWHDLQLATISNFLGLPLHTVNKSIGKLALPDYAYIAIKEADAPLESDIRFSYKVL